MHHATSLLASTAACVVTAIARTVHLAGDSTMVATGNNDGTAGWGKYLPDYISLDVNNKAVAGRSARSYTREGRFTSLAQEVQQGDYVVIEFGHNDGGSLSSTDNGRTDCPPTGAEGYAATCKTTYNGSSETVLTYYAYLVNASALFQSKGANVIISSPTPDNVWEGGKYAYSPTKFVGYARDAANHSKSTFVDHQNYTAAQYKSLGNETVNSYYPHDHTHTSPEGANVVAKAFVQALEATNSGLKDFINKTRAVSRRDLSLPLSSGINQST